MRFWYLRSVSGGEKAKVVPWCGAGAEDDALVVGGCRILAEVGNTKISSYGDLT